MDFYVAENLTLRKVDQKYVTSFDYVGLEKEGEDQLDRQRDKWSVIESQGGEEYPTYSKGRKSWENILKLVLGKKLWGLNLMWF